MKNGLIRAWDYSVMKIDLRDLKSQSVNENNNVQVRRFSATEVEQIVTSSHRPPGRQDESYFLRHLANGALVYGASFKGDPVAWRLFRPHQLNLWNWIRLEVGPTSYIGLGAFTGEAFRGQRLQQRLLNAAAEDLIQAGVWHVTNAVETGNSAAQASHRRIGMQVVSQIEANIYPFGFKSVSIDGRRHFARYTRKRRLVHWVE